MLVSSVFLVFVHYRSHRIKSRTGFSLMSAKPIIRSYFYRVYLYGCMYIRPDPRPLNGIHFTMPSTTKLSLTAGEDPRNNILYEDGRVVYKIVTPFAVIGRKTTISKIVDSGLPRLVAEIEWHSITSSIFKFDGGEVSTSNYFSSTALSGIIGR